MCIRDRVGEDDPLLKYANSPDTDRIPELAERARKDRTLRAPYSKEIVDKYPLDPTNNLTVDESGAGPGKPRRRAAKTVKKDPDVVVLSDDSADEEKSTPMKPPPPREYITFPFYVACSFPVTHTIYRHSLFIYRQAADMFTRTVTQLSFYIVARISAAQVYSYEADDLVPVDPAHLPKPKKVSLKRK